MNLKVELEAPAICNIPDMAPFRISTLNFGIGRTKVISAKRNIFISSMAKQNWVFGAILAQTWQQVPFSDPCCLLQTLSC
jgi:hypothetical protein